MPVFSEPKTVAIYLYKGQDTEFLFSLKSSADQYVPLAGRDFYIELDDGSLWTSATGHWTEVDENTKRFRLPKAEIEPLEFTRTGGKMFYDPEPGVKSLLYKLDVYLDK